jgi:hypothetical protein
MFKFLQTLLKSIFDHHIKGDVIVREKKLARRKSFEIKFNP